MYVYGVLMPWVLSRCWLGGRKGIQPGKKTEWWDAGHMQICIWPSWCHCHPLSLAPVNPDWLYLPGFNFLVPAHPVIPEQNPGGLQNGCVSVCVCARVHVCVHVW